MFAVIAAVLFAIAFIINAASIATDAVFAPLAWPSSDLRCSRCIWLGSARPIRSAGSAVELTLPARLSS